MRLWIKLPRSSYLACTSYRRSCGDLVFVLPRSVDLSRLSGQTFASPLSTRWIKDTELLNFFISTRPVLRIPMSDMGLTVPTLTFRVMWLFFLSLIIRVEAHFGGAHHGVPEGAHRSFQGALAPESRWHAAKPTHFHTEAPDWDHEPAQAPAPTASPNPPHSPRGLLLRQNALTTCAYIQGDISTLLTFQTLPLCFGLTWLNRQAYNMQRRVGL